MSHFGSLVKKLRSESGLTLEAVAKKIGSHKGYVSGIENHKVTPPVGEDYFEIRKALWSESQDDGPPSLGGQGSGHHPGGCGELSQMVADGNPGVIEVAVGLLVLQAIAINRLAGTPYPLWRLQARHPDPVSIDRKLFPEDSCVTVSFCE